MNAPDLTRLHAARMRNDETRFAMEDMRPRFDTLRDRHTNGTAPRAVAAHQLFQTPASLAARMVQLADPRPGLSWLEPSAGLGRILAPIMTTDPASVTACEIDPELSGELFRMFPQVTLWQGDFLERKPSYEGGGALIVKPFPGGPVHFDRIVANAPFTRQSDIKHTMHALKMLKPGGVMVGLCMSGEAREKAIRPLCDLWEEIPAGAFRAEGTDVVTILFRIRK